jgi:type II secretory pathway pseudopilin PulG
MRIFGFRRKELIAVAVILLTISAVTYSNLQVSLRRGRDLQRKNDIRTIHDALIEYMNDESSFPQEFQGRIVACLGEMNDEGVSQQVPCDWHRDGLANIYKDIVYLEHLPTDPQHNDGARYYYISNGRYFQIYAALEGSDEDEYDEAIVARDIRCGDRVCNYGRGFQGTPLDKSIEEYENELRRLNQLQK